MNKFLKSLLAVLALFACVAGGLYLYQHYMRERYSAQTKFQILQSSAPDVYSGGYVPPPGTGNWLDNQFAIISSSGNLTRVVNHLHLDAEWGVPPAEAVARLEKQVEVTFDRGTEIVSVTARAEIPDMAAAIASAVRKAYEEHRNEVEQERFRRLAQNLEAQIEYHKKKVETNKSEMEALQKKYGIADVVPLSSGTPGGPTPTPTPQNQQEYAAAKQRHESSVMLLNTIREISDRQKVDEAIIKQPIEVLEEARPSP